MENRPSKKTWIITIRIFYFVRRTEIVRWFLMDNKYTNFIVPASTSIDSSLVQLILFPNLVEGSRLIYIEFTWCCSFGRHDGVRISMCAAPTRSRKALGLFFERCMISYLISNRLWQSSASVVFNSSENFAESEQWLWLGMNSNLGPGKKCRLKKSPVFNAA